MHSLWRGLAVLTLTLALPSCGSTPAQESNACESGADCPSGVCIAGVCSESFTTVSEADGTVVNDAGLDQPTDAADRDANADDDTTTEDVADDVVAHDAADADTAIDADPSDIVDPDVPTADTGDDTRGEPDAIDPDAVEPDAVEPDAVEPDAVDPDAVEPDTVGPDAATDTIETRNLCGGFANLDAVPGSACGPCGLDQWTCDGTEAVVCSGATAANACGGCFPVDLAPGASCGDCGEGVVVCDSADTTSCERLGEVANACGGCEPLDGMPGASCGTCETGAWVCTDAGGVRCRGDEGEGALNACGGCGVLASTPGDACGVCDGGVWTCAGDEQVVCREAAPPVLNACGGCSPLDARIGGACGTCDSGVWACDGPEAAFCGGDAGDAATNLCGGCGELPEVPGTPCDECGALWQCAADGGVFCEASPRNACGGCAELDGAPGDRCFRPFCGFAASPVLVCDGADALECVCEGPPAGCGDGVWDGAIEECDDGNVTGGDGCSVTCESEAVLDDTATCRAAPRLPLNGRVDFDLCDADDDEDNLQTDACAGTRSADDVVGVIEIVERSTVFLDARDADPSVPVDVVVYIRSQCTLATSQLACGDDAPCDAAPEVGGCIGAVQPRVAQVEVELDPGTYWVIVDNYEYTTGGVRFACGEVRLEITTTPL